MGKIILSSLLFFSVFSFSQIGIGTNTPHSSAILDLNSKTKGFLPPRITASQRNTITSAEAGLEIWCTDCGRYGETQIYNGSSWTNLGGGTISGVTTPGTNTISTTTLSIGIGTTTPSASAALELNSNSKGFLVPRMTYSQRNDIANPVGGLQVYCSDCGAGELQIYNGSYWSNSLGGFAIYAPPFEGKAVCDGTRPTKIVDISFVYKGVVYTWMDRNLGASQPAISSKDKFSYGCMYQWGRGNDGHASVNWISSTSGTGANDTTTTKSTTTNPGHDKYICNPNGNNSINFIDWMTPTPSIDAETRWKSPSGVNNPCPSGYRIPTKAEFSAYADFYKTITGLDEPLPAVFYEASPLKIPFAGQRKYDGSISVGTFVSTSDLYFSNDAAGSGSDGYSVWYFNSNSTKVFLNNYLPKTTGMPVRCIKIP